MRHVQVGSGSRQGSSTDGIFTDGDSSLGEPVPASSATVEVGDEPGSWLEEEEPQAVPVRPTELSFDLPSQQGQRSRRPGRNKRQPRGKLQRGPVRPQNFTGGDSAEGCSDSNCPQGGMAAKRLSGASFPLRAGRDRGSGASAAVKHGGAHLFRPAWHSWAGRRSPLPVTSSAAKLWADARLTAALAVSPLGLC